MFYFLAPLSYLETTVYEMYFKLTNCLYIDPSHFCSYLRMHVLEKSGQTVWGKKDFQKSKLKEQKSLKC